MVYCLYGVYYVSSQISLTISLVWFQFQSITLKAGGSSIYIFHKMKPILITITRIFIWAIWVFYIEQLLFVSKIAFWLFTSKTFSHRHPITKFQDLIVSQLHFQLPANFGFNFQLFKNVFQLLTLYRTGFQLPTFSLTY